MKKKELKTQIKDLQTELQKYKEIYKDTVEENTNLKRAMVSLLEEVSEDTTTRINPRDIGQSLAIKSLKALDESGEVFDLEGVALLLDMDDQWKEIRQDKGLE